MIIKKLKRHESPGIDQIPGQLNKASSIKIRFETRKLINSIWNKEDFTVE